MVIPGWMPGTLAAALTLPCITSAVLGPAYLLRVGPATAKCPFQALQRQAQKALVSIQEINLLERNLPHKKIRSAVRGCQTLSLSMGLQPVSFPPPPLK